MVMGRWLPPFGIAFTVDLFGALMALAAAIAALAGSLYALTDIDAGGRRFGFFPFLMLLMAGVSGVFLTGDIFNLYVWFEVLLISSFGLLILGSEREQIDGAMKYAVLNLIGTTLFLIAVGYLYAIFGTLNMADIALKAAGLRDTAPLMTLAALFLLAFAMKAAAFPVNFWLPASYHTPRIVVSALFAGLLTKVGIYALIRVVVMLLPVEREALSLMIALVGAATVLIGALGALAQTDIRRMLGYVVISGIGNMLAGIAIGTPGGVSGAVFYALHSVVLMMALYLLAGQAARLGGSFQLSALGGLYRECGWFRRRLAHPLPRRLRPAAVFRLLAEGHPRQGLARYRRMVACRRPFGRRVPDDRSASAASSCSPTGARRRRLCRGASRSAGQSALPLLALTALVTGFGILPEPLLSLAQAAAGSLADPGAYIHSVFPEGAAQ